MDLRVFNIHFTYIESENKTLCHHCKKKYAGKSMHNLKRHLTDKHQEQANDTNVKYREKRPASTSTADEAPPQKKLKKLVASDFIRSSVELVVLNLLPYSIFSMKAFKDLIYNHQVTTGITMNYCNAQKYVTETAKALKQKIKLEVKDRMIGLKVDVATRLGRSVLGINIQFFSEIERKILVRTIGMIEMHRRHTAENINLIISSLLGEYGIDKRSVASFTCDNGANIVATAKLFQNYQNSLLLCDELEELGQQLNDEEIDDEDDAENFDENGPLDIPSNIKDALKDITSVAVLVRCSIHTLQLCVHDSLNDIKKDYRNELDEIRKVVKNLKSSTYCEQIKSLKIKVPGIDVITRWNSSFIMIRKLINIQEDLNSLFEYFSGDALEKIKLETRHWTFMQKFYDAFLPCYNLTMKLQSSDVGMGDFYASWKKTMFDMKDNLEQNEFSKIVFDHMRQRSIKLFENNDILLASLYIDPRFNFNGRQFFSDTQNCRAEAYILKVCKQVARLKSVDPLNVPNDVGCALTEFDLFLDEDFESIQQRVPENDDKKLLDKIQKCRFQSRILVSNENFNIFSYLEAKYSNDPVMLEACYAIAATPSNQSSVERCFSALRILLSHLRFNLSSSMINDILICHLNCHLLSKIDFNMIEI